MLKAGRLKGANGNQGDAVWSNLVSEAWQLRGRGGEKELLIRVIKKERYTISPQRRRGGGAPSIHGGQVLS